MQTAQAASAAPSQGIAVIDLALVSHTNIGKTTLARTLLARDVGEVRDAPHVTDSAESWDLVCTETGDRLRLWDTPGFGDSVRLVRRLRRSDNPLGWLLREVWDRYRDRPLWCSQQVVRAARDCADLVLYLANAAEDPRAAGYLMAEMEILRWLGRPVIVLLNQLGPPRPSADEQAELQRWRDYFAPLGLVSAVLPFDAFARCWVQDGILFDAIARALPSARQSAIERLRARRLAQGVERFEEAMAQLALPLANAACDAEPFATAPADGIRRLLNAIGNARGQPDPAREQAMTALAARVDERTRASTEALIELHGLHGSAARTVLDRLRAHYTAREHLDETRSALFGSAVTGALAGLKADLASGGLSFGAGMLVGGLVGGLAGAGLARGVNRLRGEPQFRWSDGFLDLLVRASLLRYLAIAHFGRGRGKYVDSESPAFWQLEVERVVADCSEQWHGLWQQARRRMGGIAVPSSSDAVMKSSADQATGPQPPFEAELAAELAVLLSASAGELLFRLYPDSDARALRRYAPPSMPEGLSSSR